MGSGDVYRISEVVRDLWRRDHVSGVSMGEKNMLTKARQILISELALAQKSTGEEASDVLDGVLATIVAA
jgi:CarD family transcriptional regulator